MPELFEMKYFEAVIGNKNRWTLAIQRKFQNGESVDIWAYSQGVPASMVPVPYFVDAVGDVVDFNPTAFGSIVVSRRMAEIVNNIAGNEIQRIPAVVSGSAGQWEVLNITSVVDCIDYNKSLITQFPPNHPGKAGKPRGVLRLVVDGGRAKGHHIFLPKDWIVAVVVSEDLMKALDEAHMTGIEYWPVN